MRGRRVAQREVTSFARGIVREVTRARAATVMPERRAADPTPETSLPDREGHVLVEAVIEAVPFVEPADLFQDPPAQTHADGVDDDDVLAGRLHGRSFGKAVHDRTPDEPAVPADVLRPVETRHPDAGVAERVDELLETAGIRELGVVVENAEKLRLCCGPCAVERGDHGRVVVVLDEMKRVGIRKGAEKLAAAVGRSVVDDDEAKRLRGGAEAVEQPTRERELVEDGNDESDALAQSFSAATSAAREAAAVRSATSAPREAAAIRSATSAQRDVAAPRTSALRDVAAAAS